MTEHSRSHITPSKRQESKAQSQTGNTQDRTIIDHPDLLTPEKILQLQRQFGNQFVTKLVQGQQATNPSQTSKIQRQTFPKMLQRDEMMLVKPQPKEVEENDNEIEEEEELETTNEEQNEVSNEDMDTLPTDELIEQFELSRQQSDSLEKDILSYEDEEELTPEEELDQIEEEQIENNEIPENQPDEDPDIISMNDDLGEDYEMDIDEMDLEMVDDEIDTEMELVEQNATELKVLQKEIPDLAQQIVDMNKLADEYYQQFEMMGGDRSDNPLLLDNIEERLNQTLEDIEQYEDVLADFMDQVDLIKTESEESEAKLKELFKRREEVAPKRNHLLSYGTRKEMKKWGKRGMIALKLAGGVTEVALKVVSTAMAVVALVKTLKHIRTLASIAKDTKDPDVKEAIKYTIGKKKAKVAKKTGKLLQFGAVFTVYGGVKGVIKKLRGTKGKNRKHYAQILHKSARMGDQNAIDVIKELTGNNYEEAIDPKNGVSVLEDKLKST